MSSLRGRVGWWLRKWADRIDLHGAPRLIHWSFTFERGQGVKFREDGKGCRLAYLGEAEYERAHAEADSPPPRVDWKNGTVSWPSDLRRRLAECRAHDDNPPADQSNCPLPHTSLSYVRDMNRHLRMTGLPPLGEPRR